MLQIFATARAKASDKAPFDRLSDELRAESEEFRAWWLEGDVQSFNEGVKRIRHPARELIDLDYVALTPEGQPDLSLVTYLARPAGVIRSHRITTCLPEPASVCQWAAKVLRW